MPGAARPPARRHRWGVMPRSVTRRATRTASGASTSTMRGELPRQPRLEEQRDVAHHHRGAGGARGGPRHAVAPPRQRGCTICSSAAARTRVGKHQASEAGAGRAHRPGAGSRRPKRETIRASASVPGATAARAATSLSTAAAPWRAKCAAATALLPAAMLPVSPTSSVTRAPPTAGVSSSASMVPAAAARASTVRAASRAAEGTISDTPMALKPWNALPKRPTESLLRTMAGMPEPSRMATAMLASISLPYSRHLTQLEGDTTAGGRGNGWRLPRTYAIGGPGRSGGPPRRGQRLRRPHLFVCTAYAQVRFHPELPLSHPPALLRRGQSFVGLLLVLLVLTLLTAFAAPHVDLSRLRSDAVARQAAAVFSQAARGRAPASDRRAGAGGLDGASDRHPG